MIQTLEKKKRQCAKVAEGAEKESAAAGKTKDVAQNELLSAKPALDTAMSALDAITTTDVKVLSRLERPPLMVQIIMDTVLI